MRHYTVSCPESEIALRAKSSHHWLPDLCRPEALAWLALLAVVLAVVLELMVSGARFSLVNLGQSCLLTLWIMLISFAFSCQVRRLSADWPPWATALMLQAGMQIAAFFGALGQAKVTAEPLADAMVPLQMLALILGLLAQRFFYLHYLEQQKSEMLRRAEYDLLQARIQPHFLFNTLNSIASLTQSNPQAAEEAVLNLADLMRISLEAGSKTVSLADELDLVEKYLQIEALRMGDRLHWDFDLDASVAGVLLPPLTIQPLIENAVLHGIAKLPKGGSIHLQARLEQGRLSLSITNPVAELQASAGNEIALANVETRLRTAFGEEMSFKAGRKGDEYRVLIESPLP